MNHFDNLLEAAESGQKSIKDTYRLLEENAAALRKHDAQVLELLRRARQGDGGSQAKFIERKPVVESSRRGHEGSIYCARKQKQ